jgi:hypothetical protein
MNDNWMKKSDLYGDSVMSLLEALMVAGDEHDRTHPTTLADLLGACCLMLACFKLGENPGPLDDHEVHELACQLAKVLSGPINAASRRKPR